MSFSGEVKRELADIVPEGRHCQIAELAAIYALAGDRMGVFADDMLANAGEIPILRTENAILQRKFFTLYEKAFMMGEVGNSRRQMSAGGSVAEAFFRAVRHPMLLKRECCRRSFLRGAFLAAGSISDPKKHYHYEIVCPDGGTAARVREVLTGFGLDAKTVRRKQSEVVYLKEGDQIVYAVGEMGASKALLELENVRIYHELRGMVNRQVNCDVANARKSAEMSARQVKDIEFIREHMGLSGLPVSLQDMARVRLEYPDATLQELGDLLEPKIGKSGVNHRLRRLGEIAADLRKKEEKEAPGDREEVT